MRALVGAILAAFVSVTSAAAPTGTVPLDAAQSRALLQALCDEPVEDGKPEFGGTRPACRTPHDYPTHLACPLSLRGPVPPVSPGPEGTAMLHRGRFTADEPQAIVFYAAGCEPHSNNGGGMALLRDTPQGFVLIRYVPGLVGVECVVAPSDGGEHDTLYCITSHVGQGDLEQRFGPVRFAADGSATVPSWLAAGNLDDYLAPMTACPKPKPTLHHFTGIAYDGATRSLMVSGAVLTKKHVASACARLARQDFNERELERRSMGGPVTQSMAFLRDDELRFVLARVRFTPPSDKPVIEMTAEPAPDRPAWIE